MRPNTVGVPVKHKQNEQEKIHAVSDNACVWHVGQGQAGMVDAATIQFDSTVGTSVHMHCRRSYALTLMIK
jgi:hypothetical protein